MNSSFRGPEGPLGPGSPSLNPAWANQLPTAFAPITRVGEEAFDIGTSLSTTYFLRPSEDEYQPSLPAIPIVREPKSEVSSVGRVVQASTGDHPESSASGGPTDEKPRLPEQVAEEALWGPVVDRFGNYYPGDTPATTEPAPAVIYEEIVADHETPDKPADSETESDRQLEDPEGGESSFPWLRTKEAGGESAAPAATDDFSVISRMARIAAIIESAKAGREAFLGSMEAEQAAALLADPDAAIDAVPVMSPEQLMAMRSPDTEVIVIDLAPVPIRAIGRAAVPPGSRALGQRAATGYELSSPYDEADLSNAPDAETLEYIRDRLRRPDVATGQVDPKLTRKVNVGEDQIVQAGGIEELVKRELNSAAEQRQNQSTDPEADDSER